MANGTRYPHYFQQLMSPKFKQRQRQTIKNISSNQDFNDDTFEYPYELSFSKNRSNKNIISINPQTLSNTNLQLPRSNIKQTHHYTPSDPYSQNHKRTNNKTKKVDHKLTISNHLNPIKKKTIIPLIKNSKNVRPNSEDSKNYQLNHSTLNILNQSHGDNIHGQGHSYMNGKCLLSDDFRRRAQSQKKNYLQSQIELDRFNRGIKSKPIYHILDNKKNIDINQVYLNENSSPPYKPITYNFYNKNNNMQANMSQSLCNQDQRIFTPSALQSPLTQINRSPQFTSAYPNSLTSSLSSMKIYTQLESNRTSIKKKIIQNIENQKKKKMRIDKDSKFLQKCLYHIMVQNNCLSKQMVLKQMELSRLKNKLSKYQLKIKKQQDFSSSMNKNEMDNSSEMQVIISNTSQQDEEIEENWRTDYNLHHRRQSDDEYEQDDKIKKQGYWQIKRDRKNEMKRRDSIQKDEQKQKTNLNIEYSVSKQIKQVKQQQEQSYYKSYQNNNQLQQQEQNKQQQIQNMGSMTKRHKKDKDSKYYQEMLSKEIKSEDNVNLEHPRTMQEASKDRMYTIQNDREVDFNLQEVHQLIEQIQIQQYKLKFKSVISVDSPLANTNFNLFSNPNMDKSANLNQTVNPSPTSQTNPNLNIAQKTHRLQGLDVTRLDRLRMRKGVISKKKQFA